MNNLNVCDNSKENYLTCVRRSLNKLLRILATHTLLFLPLHGYAFKIDTHLWIGQQVFNDLEDDGNISIKLGDKILALPVSSEITDAILGNRNEFLLGNIGPDALPDVVVGQSVVHPGLGAKNGWNTNDWLKYLLKKSENNSLGKAFAYGYLGHAASDVFAHTFVNQYSGDIFELDNETLTEERHISLEGYIARHNPLFLTANSQFLGEPWEIVKPPSDGLAEFVRDNLILGDEVQSQYGKASYAKHMVVYNNYRKALISAANSQIWQDIDKAILQSVASYYGYSINSDEAESLINFVNEQVIPKVQENVNLTQEEINRLNTAIDRYDSLHHDAITNSLRQIISLNSQIANLVAQRIDADSHLCQRIEDNVCHFLFGWLGSFGGKICELHTQLSCPISEAVGQSAADLIRSIDDQLNGTNGLHNQLLQSVSQLREQLVTVKNSQLDIAQRIIDFGQVLSNNTSPVKALLQNWIADLDLAMAEYVKASTNTIINTINPTISGLDKIKPMTDWFDCYHLGLVGIPSAIGTGSCGFRGSVDSVLNSFDNIQHIIEDSVNIAPANMAGLPSPASIRAEIEGLKQSAINQIKQAAINELKDILPPEVQDVITVSGEVITDERLQYYFTKPDFSGKNLLMINDVAQRVKAEMNVVGDEPYDPEKFAPVYNAIVLAKLALLDSTGLALLAEEAGVPYSIDGNALFANTPNVVADAFASIDGNHAWMDVAPPYPGTGAPYRTAFRESFPFSGYASVSGFVPWRPEVRDVLFRRLFIGPLSPGVESAKEIGFSEILPADYPYRPCFQYPFPNESNDLTCSELLSVTPGASPSSTLISLSASSQNVEEGRTLILQAMVSGNNPTGNVVFYDNNIAIGEVPLTINSASMSLTSLGIGNHVVSVSYSGDTNNTNSTAKLSTPVNVYKSFIPTGYENRRKYPGKRVMAP